MMTVWEEDNPPDAGRPPGRVRGLHYSRPSDTLVAMMALDEPPAHRLYYRRLPESTYLPVAVRHELESQETAHCCEQAPFVFFNEMRFTKFPPTAAYLKTILKSKAPTGGGWGSDWVAIRRFDLVTGEDTVVLDEGSLRPPAPYTSGWVCEIMSIAADGSGAVCVVGLTGGKTGGKTSGYFVYELSFAGGLGRKVADLPRTFL